MKKFFAILAAVAIVALAVPVLAADAPGPQVTVGGRMLTDFGYHNTSKELTSNGKNDVTTAFINLAGHSYLHAKFTSADKTSGGFIEFGLSSKVNDNESISLRYAYGWWKVGNCKLLAGQDDGWVGTLKHAPKQYLGVSESAKLLLANWGYIYSARSPQVRFEYMKGNFGASIALVQPMAEATPGATGVGMTTGSASLPGGTDLYATLPRFDVAVQFTAGGFWAGPGFGWAQYKVEKGSVTMSDDTVTSWIGILPVKFTAGPFTAKAEVHYGQNNDYEWSGELITGIKGLPRSMAFANSAGRIEDTKQLGGFLALEYKITPMFEVTAGYGIEKLTNDSWKKDAGYKNDDYTRSAWFVALPITVTKNFSLHPEFNYFNYGDKIQNGQDFGNEWMLGLQFRFVF
ncbi:MAG: hypothetical protein V1797_03000 [Pseudomonadota bacterium]